MRKLIFILLLFPLLGAGQAVGYWRFNSSVVDALGLHNGSATNIGYVQGISSYAANFNGISSKITTANNINLSGNLVCSVSFWMYCTDTTVLSGIVGWGFNNTCQAFVIFSNSLGGMIVSYAGGIAAYYSTNLRQNKWYYITVTKAAGAINTTTKLYVNGVLQSQDAGTSTASPNVTNSTVTIGYGAVYGGYYYKGILDNVIIYNSVLTPGLINNYYSSDKAFYQ